MTREEKLQLNRERQKAVREAWSREKKLVEQGKGTVNWNEKQQKELMEKGYVKGYEGQHMKSVSKYPQYAGSVDNIQLLSHEDHLAAHNSGKEKSGYRSPTNGYFDSNNKTMHSFGKNPPRAPKTIQLSTPCYQSSASSNSERNGKDGIKSQSALQTGSAYSTAGGGQKSAVNARGRGK